MFNWQKRSIAKLLKECKELHKQGQRQVLEQRIRREIDETLNSITAHVQVVKHLEARTRTLTIRLLKVMGKNGVSL